VCNDFLDRIASPLDPGLSEEAVQADRASAQLLDFLLEYRLPDPIRDAGHLPPLPAGSRWRLIFFG